MTGVASEDVLRQSCLLGSCVRLRLALSTSITPLSAPGRLMSSYDGLDTRQFVEMINDSVFPGPFSGDYGDAIVHASYTPRD
jgi:hypothetical protein